MKEKFLNDDIQQQLRDTFAALAAPVKLVVFTQGEGGALECAMCADTRQLAEEVSALSPLLSVEVRDFVKDAEVAEHSSSQSEIGHHVAEGGMVNSRPSSMNLNSASQLSKMI